MCIDYANQKRLNPRLSRIRAEHPLLGYFALTVYI